MILTLKFDIIPKPDQSKDVSIMHRAGIKPVVARGFSKAYFLTCYERISCDKPSIREDLR